MGIKGDILFFVLRVAYLGGGEGQVRAYCGKEIGQRVQSIGIIDCGNKLSRNKRAQAKQLARRVVFEIVEVTKHIILYVLSVDIVNKGGQELLDRLLYQLFRFIFNLG